MDIRVAFNPFLESNKIACLPKRSYFVSNPIRAGLILPRINHRIERAQPSRIDCDIKLFIIGQGNIPNLGTHFLELPRLR